MEHNQINFHILILYYFTQNKQIVHTKILLIDRPPFEYSLFLFLKFYNIYLESLQSIAFILVGPKISLTK